MPSIGHLLLGGMLSLILYYFGDKKNFTKYHAFILFVNNYLGPDLGRYGAASSEPGAGGTGIAMISRENLRSRFRSSVHL